MSRSNVVKLVVGLVVLAIAAVLIYFATLGGSKSGPVEGTSRATSEEATDSDGGTTRGGHMILDEQDPRSGN